MALISTFFFSYFIIIFFFNWCCVLVSTKTRDWSLNLQTGGPLPILCNLHCTLQLSTSKVKVLCVIVHSLFFIICFAMKRSILMWSIVLFHTQLLDLYAAMKWEYTELIFDLGSKNSVKAERSQCLPVLCSCKHGPSWGSWHLSKEVFCFLGEAVWDVLRWLIAVNETLSNK